MKAKLCLATSGEFGQYRNLKTEVSKALVNGMKQVDPRPLIICRDFKRAKEQNIRKAIPFGRKLIYLIQGTLKALTGSMNGAISDYLIDRFTSFKINRCDLLYAIPPSYLTTIRKVKANGGLAVIHAGTSHPLYSSEVGMKEGIKATRISTWARDRRLKTIQEADYIFALSDFVRETYLQQGVSSDKIYVTPLGVDEKRFKPGDKKDTVFRVIGVANYSSKKGYQYLLEAWKNLKLENAELVLVGNPDQYMERLVKEYQHICPNIRSVRHTDPLQYYQSASVFVHPSLTEGSAKVTYEAMACGLPVLCTHESGSIIEDSKEGYIIQSRDVESIQERLLELYNTPERADEMGRKGRMKILEGYTWDHYAERVATYLREILDKRNKGDI